jgi:copper chaperone CopZ
MDMEKKIIELTLQVAGITCTGCAEDTQTILNNTEGVLSASVNYAEGLIHIRYDQNEIGEEGLMARIQKMGLKISGKV